MPSLKFRNLFRREPAHSSLRERAAELQARIQAPKPPAVAISDRSADDAELLSLGRRFEDARAHESATCEACNAAAKQSGDGKAPQDLEAAAADAGDIAAALAYRLADIPAHTADGLRLKIRALSHYIPSFFRLRLPDNPDPDQVLARSLLLDARGEALTVEPTDWHAPPPGFMAYPAIDPQGFVIIREGLRLELERLHQIALAEYARKVEPEATEATRARVRQELRLDILAPTPSREEAPTTTPTLGNLSAQILALWPVWAAHTGDDGTDEQTAAYEAMQERRFNLLDTVDALPATPENIHPKALALAWLHYVNEWRRGQKRSEYCIDERLAIDIHIAALAQSEPQKIAAHRPEPSLAGMIDFASASLDELQSLHDLADLIGGVAYATVWSGRCKARGPGDNCNAAGTLMQWLGDALTGVETAANNEARRRIPENGADRETRLEMLALPAIQNGDPNEIKAFARELLAHAEAEHRGR